MWPPLQTKVEFRDKFNRAKNPRRMLAQQKASLVSFSLSKHPPLKVTIMLINNNPSQASERYESYGSSEPTT
jgi:hypothetical protein